MLKTATAVTAFIMMVVSFYQYYTGSEWQFAAFLYLISIFNYILLVIEDD